MGERDPRVSRHRNGRAHSRHDLEGDAGIGQRFGLFAAATEYKRIAALQTDDIMAEASLRDENAVDLFLRDVVSPGALADEDFNRLGARLIEERRIDQLIVHDDWSAAQQLKAAHGQ